MNSRQGTTSELKSLRRASCDFHQTVLGQNGHVFVSDDSESASLFFYIEAWGDAEVDYEVEVDGTAVTQTGVAIPDGRFLFGKISSLDVTSGTVVAYYL